MAAGIDCVAITDRNTARWIDPLKDAYARLLQEPPPGFRELHLFPGFEVTAHAGSRLLAIFDPKTTPAELRSLLGRLEIPAVPPEPSSTCSAMTFLEIAKSIERAGGIAIPARANSSRGVLTEFSGKTLEQILQSRSIIAVELADTKFMQAVPAANKSTNWTPVLGSDSYHPSGSQGRQHPGSHFTWVKMGRPSIEGLRLALLDGTPMSIQRSTDGSPDSNPNRHADLVIDSIVIKEARLAGRGSDLRLNFSPWLTAVIGGRGTGKSTVLEMMRLCLRREQEIPHALRHDLDRFSRVATHHEEGGALTENTQIILNIRKRNDTFRVCWSQTAFSPAIQRKNQAGEWKDSWGNIRERFPVRIFSQNQILTLANQPQAIIDVVDESPSVDANQIKITIKQLEAKFLSIQSRLREQQSILGDRQKLQDKLEDITDRIRAIEDQTSREVMLAYQRTQRQIAIYQYVIDDMTRSAERIRKVARDVDPCDLREREFDMADNVELEAFQSLYKAASTQRIHASSLRDIAYEIERFTSDLSSTFESSSLQTRLRELTKNNRSLETSLNDLSLSRLREYVSLNQHRQAIQIQISTLEQTKRKIEELETEGNLVLRQIENKRLVLSKKRREFLQRCLEDNKYVRIELIPFGNDLAAQLASLRQAIQVKGTRDGLEVMDTEDPRGILVDLHQGMSSYSTEEWTRMFRDGARDIKNEIVNIRQHRDGDRTTKQFREHILNLHPEQIDRVQIWWPQDGLRILYRRSQDSEWSPITTGSPGQKSAAMLAFLLSSGTEPLVLDQPEDDLDNHVIYDLIVEQIRLNKGRRQVIVATHNPNIVVNGDAEQVIAMDYRGGQCQLAARGTGCLQELAVRQGICKMMEGGRKAFRSRQKRLELGGRHAV